MTTPDQARAEYYAGHQARYERVVAGEEDAPACYTCARASTHVSRTITPAGVHAYACPRHARTERAWGSDPGWTVDFILLDDAHANWSATLIR